MKISYIELNETDKILNLYKLCLNIAVFKILFSRYKETFPLYYDLQQFV